MAVRKSLALLLCGAALLGLVCAQTTSDARWYSGVGGSVDGGDGAVGMAIEGDRRFIAGKVSAASTDATKEYNEFAFSDGTNSEHIDNSLFIAKVTAAQDLKWQRPPRSCRNDRGGKRICNAKDNWYFSWDEGTNAKNIVDMGAGGGKAVVLLKDTPLSNAFSFQQISDDGWTTIISAEAARVPAIGSSPTNFDTWGRHTDAPASLKLISSSPTNNRFYALFAYTGNVRIGKTVLGKVEKTYIVKANGTYVQMSTVDQYDISTNDAVIRNGFGGTVSTDWVSAWTHRSGYLLVSLDIHTGDLKWVQPIWAQKTAEWGVGVVSISASKYDEAVYLQYSSLKSRVIFGAANKFQGDNYVLDSGFSSGSTTVQPLLDGWSGITYSNLMSNYDIFNTYHYLQRIDSEGTVSQPLRMLNSDSAGFGTRTVNANTRTYARSAGEYWMIGAADDSTNVYVAAVFKPNVTSQVVSTTYATKFYLGSSDYYSTQMGINITGTGSTTVSTVYYDDQDAFFFAYDGTTLPTTTSPKWIGQVFGINDRPEPNFVAGDGSRMYVEGSFGNYSYYGAGILNSKTLAKMDDFIIAVNAADGAFSDAATISGNYTVDHFEVNDNRAYVYGTVTGQMSLDVLNSNIPGLTVHSRGAGASLYQATFAKDLPGSEGSERDGKGGPNKKKLALGLGLGLGLGIPFVVALCYIAYTMLKNRGSANMGVSGVKVEPA